MNGIQSGTRDKLMKLIRLLSSDKDGEKLGAIAGIERILKANGLSFHELAGALADKIVEVKTIVVEEKVKVQTVVVREEVDHACVSWIKAADDLIQNGKLSEKEHGFITDMKMRFSLNKNYEPSDKQSGWMAAIYKREFPNWKERAVA